MKWVGYVYCLRDPRDGLIRYVGMTDDAGRRSRQHRDNRARRNKQKHRWTLQLKLLGLEPLFHVLEECDLYQLRGREIYWINRLTAEGCQLYNLALPTTNQGTK